MGKYIRNRWVHLHLIVLNFLLSCLCLCDLMHLPHGAMSWSVICECGIFWSYSFVILIIHGHMHSLQTRMSRHYFLDYSQVLLPVEPVYSYEPDDWKNIPLYLKNCMQPSPTTCVLKHIHIVDSPHCTDLGLHCLSKRLLK